jgi:hypothetical protein
MKRNSRELDNFADSIYKDNLELDDLPYYNDTPNLIGRPVAYARLCCISNEKKARLHSVEYLPLTQMKILALRWGSADLTLKVILLAASLIALLA